MARVNERYYELCGEDHICSYCGIPCDEIDHTVPVSFVNQKPDVGRIFKLMKVHSCGECNRFASDYIHQTFFERRIFIAKAFARRYKKLLSSPPWDEEELSEMGYAMQQSVRVMQENRKELKERMSVLMSSDIPEGLRDNLWEPVFPLEYGAWTGPNHNKEAHTIMRDIQKTLRALDKLYTMWR